MANDAQGRAQARRNLRTTAPLAAAGPIMVLAGLAIGSRLDSALVFYGLPVLGIVLMVAAVVIAQRGAKRSLR